MLSLHGFFTQWNWRRRIRRAIIQTILVVELREILSSILRVINADFFLHVTPLLSG